MEGKVKSLSKFGAFITLPDGSTGMVHISEIAQNSVSDAENGCYRSQKRRHHHAVRCKVHTLWYS